MKKSYILLLTILLLVIFSFLVIFVFETKSFQTTFFKDKYLYIQGKNHKKFFSNLIKNKDLKNINSLKIETSNFIMKAKIKKLESYYEVEIFINSLNNEVSLYEKFIKE